MNRVVHFELPAGDSKRASSFYSDVFGWQTQMMGPEMGNYVLAMTTESDPETGPMKPGAINGGIFPKDTNPQQQHPSVVIEVDDIKAHMQKVQAAGGTVHGEPQDIPGVGQFVPFTDTEGNMLSMIQPPPRP
jgi:uncharacterized protein